MTTDDDLPEEWSEAAAAFDRTMKQAIAAAVCLVAAGCSPARPVPDPPAQVAIEPATTSSPPEPPTAEAATVLWSDSIDLDGDGAPEPVALTTSDVIQQGAARGDEDPRIGIKIESCQRGDPPVEGCRASLRVGGQEQPIELQSGYFGGIGIRGIDIDPGDAHQELLLTQRGGDSEDPPFVFTVATYRGGRLRLKPLFVSYGYNSGEVKLDRSGKLVVVYDECPDKTTVTYAFRGDELSQIDKKVERLHDPNSCAACPHVFVRQAAGFIHKGEILRDLRGSERRGWQSLALAHPERFAAEDGAIVVELRELEREITFVFGAQLELNGTMVTPDDFSPAILRQGDAIELRFPSGLLPSASEARLWLDGYYLFE